MRETKPDEVIKMLERDYGDVPMGAIDAMDSAVDLIRRLVYERDTAEELLREYRREITR